MTRSAAFALPKALAALVPRGKQSAISALHGMQAEAPTGDMVLLAAANAQARKTKQPLRLGPDACDAAGRRMILEPLVDAFAQAAINLYENPMLPTHPSAPPLQPLPSLSAFLLAIVTPTEMPLGTISLALLYLQRLRRELPPSIRGGRGTAHRLALAALIIANKWSDDDSFGVRTWTKLVRRWFARGEVELMEGEMLSRMSWKLHVSRLDWEDFIYPLEITLNLPLRAAIGSEIIDEEALPPMLTPALIPLPYAARNGLAWASDQNATRIVENMVATRELAGHRLRDVLRDATEKRVSSGRSIPIGSLLEQESLRTVDSGVGNLSFDQAC